MTEIAKKIQTGRQSLYKNLSENGKPQFETIIKPFACLELKIDVVTQSIQKS